MKNNNYLILSSLLFPVVLVISGCQMKDSYTDNSATGGSTNSLTASTNSTYDAANTNGINADNSGRNVRDRDTNNLTVLDQGNSAADTQLTQQIRQMVVSSTNNFSILAQNIKIITQGGTVTLRGPVQTEVEHSNIVMLAQGLAGSTNVVDQLEVKNNQ